MKPFSNTLLSAACGMMASDGEIHPNEISEIESVIEDSPFIFGDTSSADFEALVADLSHRGQAFVSDLFVELSSPGLSEKQKLHVVRVLLRVLEADERVSDEERLFLRSATEAMGLPDALLVQRFPNHADIILGLEAFGDHVELEEIDEDDKPTDD